MENNSVSQHQQQQHSLQQPKTSPETLKMILSDLRVFIEANELEGSAHCKESAETISNSFLKLIQVPEDAPAVSYTPFTGELSSIQGFLDSLEYDIEKFLDSSLKQRIHFAQLIYTYLDSFVKTCFDRDLTLEQDDSGYLASNIILLTQTLDKIISLHHSAIQDLQSTYKVILSNPSYPAAIQGKISSAASLYLFRYHTTCKGCCPSISDKDIEKRRPIAKSPIHGAPLCQNCLDIEKDSLFFKRKEEEDKK